MHEVIEDNNIFKMRPITKGLLIEPRTSVEFKPQSYHIMFFNFNKALESNQMIEATLNFDDDFLFPLNLKS